MSSLTLSRTHFVSGASVWPVSKPCRAQEHKSVRAVAIEENGETRYRIEDILGCVDGTTSVAVTAISPFRAPF